MVEVRNPARERLERGELSLGFTVSLGRTDEAIMARYIAMGAQFMLAGSDASFITIAGTRRTAFLRNTPRTA